MYTILSEFNLIQLYNKNYFIFNSRYLPTLIKVLLNIKLKKFRLNVVKKMFLTLELMTGTKPIIKKIYFKKISKKKIQLRLIISKNISSSYIFDFMNFLFFYIIRFLTTTNKFYKNQSYFRKNYHYFNNFFYTFNLSNIFNLLTLNASLNRYIFFKNYKFKLSFFFLNSFGNIKTSFFLHLLSTIKNFKNSWINKFNEEA